MAENWEFTEQADNGFQTWADKDKMTLINEKWGLNGIKARTFNYTGELPTPFNPQTFFSALLNTKGVASEEVKSLDLEPLTTISVGNKFWKKLWTPPNNICRNATGHYINKCPDHHVRGMWLSDCLQVALLDEDSEEYEVFTQEDRKELLFQVIKLLVLGGEICQYEDEWDTYEPVITSLYRDLIGKSVVKNTSGAISVVARAFLLTKTNGKSILSNPDRSMCLLVIDTVTKKVRMLEYLAYI